MTIDQAFRALILTSEDVTDLIGDRLEVGTNTIDLRKDLPKAVYTCIDDEEEYDDDGLVGIAKALYQIDVFAVHHADANAILSAIAAVFEDEDTFPYTNEDIEIVRVFRKSRQHDQTQKTAGAETGLKRISRDFRVMYRVR